MIADNIATSAAKGKNFSFVDLQRFILNEMRMQMNYQPIMIKILLENGGSATKDVIASKIKELNDDLLPQFENSLPD